MNESTEIKIERFEETTTAIAAYFIIISIGVWVLNLFFSITNIAESLPLGDGLTLSLGSTITFLLESINQLTDKNYYLDTYLSNETMYKLVNDLPLIVIGVFPGVFGLSVKLVYHLWTDQNFFSKYIGNFKIFWISLILSTGNILIFIHVSKLLGVVCFIGLVIFWKYLEEKWAKEDKLEEEKKEKENKENNQF